MTRIAPFLVLLTLGCKDDAPPPGADSGSAEEIPTLEPPADGEGFQMSMTAVAPAGEETWACEVYDLPTDEYEPVNKVHYIQNPGTHHMTLSTVALSGASLEPGSHDCEELYGQESMMEDQIMFFGSQGTAEETLQLPEGVVANMPPGIQVVHEVHYVNTTSEDVTLYSVVNAYTIDPDEVTDMIWGGQVRDETIEIPANSTTSEWTRCVFNEDVEVQFLASHTHSLGVEFTVAPYDGETVGDIFYTNDDWHDPKIIQYQPALVVPAGEGFEYTCTWTNPNDFPVSYGSTSEDEMCGLAVVFTPFSTSAACEVVETSDGVLWP